MLDMTGSLAERWTLDPTVTFLNHGSFGACPREVRQAQAELRASMEREPITFLDRELEGRLDDARQALADFLGATSVGLAFVANATTGVNTVLASLSFEPGDELLTTDHAYNACRNALDAAAKRWGARVVVAPVPFPIGDEERAVEAIVEAATARTRLALVDHVTSPTALVLPVARIVRELQGRGVDVLVDGAHAPGMVPLALDQLGAAYYTGNCHKWLCAPKGSAFLYVREDRRAKVHPLVVSHGFNSRRTDRSRFRLEFDWTGTGDPTPFLSVPVALEAMARMTDRGWRGVMESNRALALSARRTLASTVGVPLPCPESMVGSMAALPLPDAPADAAAGIDGVEPIQRALFERHRIEVPVSPWPRRPHRILRVSAQLYNHPEQYRLLAAALAELLNDERGPRAAP